MEREREIKKTVRLFSVVSSGRRKGNSHNLKYRNSIEAYEKKTFILTMIEP